MNTQSASILSNGRTDARWWLPEYKAERWQFLGSVVNRLWQAQEYRRELHLRHARLYGNMPILGLGPRGYARKQLAGNTNRLAFNVVKSCCDAYTAKVTKERPKATFLTSGGNHELQQKAEGLDRFAEGQLYETGCYDKAPSVVMDSAIYGDGIFYPYIDESDGTKQIALERVFPWELGVDDEEAVYGEPRNFYRRKFIDRVVLEELFPEKRNDIAIAMRESSTVNEWGYDSTADQVTVTEAWHLRSGPNAKDGLHCIAINNAILFEEEYTKLRCPFRILKKQPSLIGFWSTGLAEELEGIQLEINVLLRKIQRSHHLLAAGHWLVQKGTVNSQKLDNDIGSIIEYTTVKPELQVGMTVSPEVYQHLDRLYEKAYEITGISQLQAQGLKPAGLDSGEAQRVYLDIQTERFQVSLRLYHNFILEIVRDIMELAREISESDPSYAVKAFTKKGMTREVFKKNFLRDEEYILKLYPTNALSSDPEAKLQQVQEMAGNGWIDPKRAMRLLGFPDLKEAMSFDDASYNYVMDIIDGMKHGDYAPPEPFMDLNDAMRWVQLGYLVAKKDGLAADKLELFITWLEQAKEMIDGANNPTPANTNAQVPQPGAPAPMAANDNGAPMPPQPDQAAMAGPAQGM